MFKKLSDKFSKGIIYLAAFLVTALMAVMMIHIVKESIPAISQLGIKMFLPTTEWRPVSQKPQYGLLPAIAGTLYVSAIAVVLALIFGIACACFLDYYLPKKVASIFLAFIDLVAGIPSVIFGFIGLTVLVKAFATHLHMAAGQCILAAGIVLGIMLLPFVISTCHESLQTARKTYEFSAITLGFSREFTLLHFILPAIRPGIIAGAMMAFGRALGETMAVMMVIGNSPIYPKLLGRGQTLPALILSILGLCVIVVTLFLFLYVFWKGKKVFSLSFLLDKPAGVPLGTAGGIYPALMGSIYLGALSALIGGVLGIGAAIYLVFYSTGKRFSVLVNMAITGLSDPVRAGWIYASDLPFWT